MKSNLSSKRNSRKALWIFAMAVTAVVGFTLIAGTQKGLAARPGDRPPGGIEVKIDNFTFGPASLTVASGTTVTWTNKDDVPHTVVSDDKATFKSKATRYGRSVLLHLCQAGQISILLLGPSEDDRRSRGAMIRRQTGD